MLMMSGRVREYKEDTPLEKVLIVGPGGLHLPMPKILCFSHVSRQAANGEMSHDILHDNHFAL